MPVFIALLRGINIGSTRSLRMERLREIVRDQGGDAVTTYIQSGNVVFTHPSRSVAKLESEMERALHATTGMVVPVAIRTLKQWSAVVAGNPFPGAGGTQLHVVFLKRPAAKDALARLDHRALLPEVVVNAGDHFYLYLPEGMGKARLPLEIERHGRGTLVGTARNWNTVLKLHALAAESRGAR